MLNWPERNDYQPTTGIVKRLRWCFMQFKLMFYFNDDVCRCARLFVTRTCVARSITLE